MTIGNLGGAGANTLASLFARETMAKKQDAKEPEAFRAELFYPASPNGLPDRAGYIEREVRALGYEGPYTARIIGQADGVKIIVEG